MAVKKLSAEQRRVQASYEQTLKAYFVIIERLVDGQVQLSRQEIDTDTDQIVALQTKKANLAIKNAVTDSDREAALKDHDALIKSELAIAESYKSEISALQQKLKSKDKEMLEAYAAIKAAQDQLDDFIQMKRADDVVLNELAATVGLNRDKVEASALEITDMSGQLMKIINKGTK